MSKDTPPDAPEFRPFTILRNAHFMTIVPAFLPRFIDPALPRSQARLFKVAEKSSIVADCHIFDRGRPVIIIVHGLEGSSRAPNVVGLANKALLLGFNVVRMNLRNCGDSLHLTPTLYNAGLSADVIAVAKELRDQDGFAQIFLAGYSLGGNIVLKAAAELGERGPQLLAGVCGISPAIDLAPCVDAMERGINRLYEQRFLIGLKAKVLKKHKVFPNLYSVKGLGQIKRLRTFDDVYTSKDAGYESAEAYYAGASAINIIDQIAVPALLIAAQDDPIVPFSSFQSPKLKTRFIELLAPLHGGHGGFLAVARETAAGTRSSSRRAVASDEKAHFGALDRFWAENRCLQFFLHQQLRK